MPIKGLYILREKEFDLIYRLQTRIEIEKLVNIYSEPLTKEDIINNPDILNDAEVIFSGWGAPALDKQFLDHAVKLKAFFYGGGSVQGIVTDAAQKREIRITSASDIISICVAQGTMGLIINSLKGFWKHIFHIRNNQSPKGWQRFNVQGIYQSTVGLISLGNIGRRVAELLQCLNVNIIAYDPHVNEADAEKLNIKLMSLEELFSNSDVVSLHAPKIPATIGMIRGLHFESMKPDSAFINTARGAIINEPEMIQALKKRPDIWTILDVTDPEPPKQNSELYHLKNIILMPHIAGTKGRDTYRLGDHVLMELNNYLEGKPFAHEVDIKAVLQNERTS